jgi:hypothetical protein
MAIVFNTPGSFFGLLQLNNKKRKVLGILKKLVEFSILLMDTL